MVALTLGLALLGYLSGSAVALALLVKNRLDEAGRALFPTLLGFAFHTISIGSACVIYGGWITAASASESFSFIAWSLVLFTMLIVWRYKVPALLSFLLPLASLTALLAFVQSGDLRLLAPLQAVPKATWLWLHVSLSLLAVAALFLAAVAGLVYLLQEQQVKSRRPGYLFRRLPSLEVCDRLGYKSLSVGFVLLTGSLMTAAVGIWSSLELRWSWDLTTSLAVAGWPLYMAVIYWRWAVGLRGRKAAYLAIVGGLSVTGILLGVLLLSGRFHPGT